jgi:hypothetical protein|tara:strand:- start:16461 stop:16907 length:447 start_codon:yes stop_codon:yes gene_type:complete
MVLQDNTQRGTTLDQLTAGYDVGGEAQTSIKQINEGLLNFNDVLYLSSIGNLSEPQKIAAMISFLKEMRRAEQMGQRLDRRKWGILADMRTEAARTSSLMLILSNSENGNFAANFIFAITRRAKEAARSFGNMFRRSPNPNDQGGFEQ